MATVTTRHSWMYGTDSMMTEMIHDVLIQRGASFRAYFTALDDQDFQAILEGPSKTLLDVLQHRYGFAPGDVRAAWNDFVMRYIDGRPGAVRHSHQSYPLPSANRCRYH